MAQFGIDPVTALLSPVKRALGLHGRPFEPLKFRTMPDAGGAGGVLRPDVEWLTRFREWGPARAYASSHQRCQATHPRLHRNNRYRPHAGIHGTTPAASALKQTDDTDACSQRALKPNELVQRVTEFRRPFRCTRPNDLRGHDRYRMDFLG